MKFNLQEDPSLDTKFQWLPSSVQFLTNTDKHVLYTFPL